MLQGIKIVSVSSVLFFKAGKPGKDSQVTSKRPQYENYKCCLCFRFFHLRTIEFFACRIQRQTSFILDFDNFISSGKRPKIQGHE